MRLWALHSPLPCVYMKLLPVIVVVVVLQLTYADYPECDMCMDIAIRAKRQGSDSQSVTKAKALQGANAYTGQMQTDYINELNCHWDKYYKDANYPRISATNPRSTCADTGFCDLSYQLLTFNFVDITNSSDNYGTKCTQPGKIILLHHTVTPTIQDTIDTLNNRGVSVQYIVARNGTIYRLVNEYYRAYHAGAGYWREVTDVNSNSVGIEIVNHGDEPFNPIQINSVEMLVANLRDRWHTDDQYIVAHADIAPSRKNDPSGYFPWQGLNQQLNILPGIFTTNLTPNQQQQVLLSADGGDPQMFPEIQNGLYKYGYTLLTMTPGVFDDNMKFNIQSFNRHWCPEVFIKEAINSTTDLPVWNPLNQRWYGLSHERLGKLLNAMH